MPTQLTAYPCPKCRGALALVTEQPEKGMGCALILAGLLFAVVIVGIPLMIWGAIVYDRKRQHWACTSCGQTFPIVDQAAPEGPPRGIADRL
ncbi:MAG: hypothetical protein L0099_03205 [Acidobacteria bacterium]|nr:hypothetical protein [Acidobacteriota bacterium]